MGAAAGCDARGAGQPRPAATLGVSGGGWGFFKTIGDAFCVAFDTPHSALVGALEAQRAAKWGETGELKVRMALHTGALDIFRELGGTRGTAKALADLAFHAFAFLALAERQDERAARLFGAAEAHRTRSGVVPSIADHPALRAIRAAAPDFTGPASAAAHDAGRALDLDAAIALATQPPQ